MKKTVTNLPWLMQPGSEGKPSETGLPILADIRVLVVPDGPQDVGRLVEQIGFSGKNNFYVQVETEAGLTPASVSKFNVILAGLSSNDDLIRRMINFLGKFALDIPLIAVVDPEREGLAVEWLSRGLDDYICQDRLARLCKLIIWAVDQRRMLKESGSRQDRQRYQLLFENSNEIILFVRLIDGKILDANREAARAYGYTREELLNLNLFNLRAPQTLSAIPVQMLQAYSSGIKFETFHQRRDSSLFPVEVSSIGANLNGEPGILSIIQDISGRKQAEEALREAEIRFRTIIDQNPAGIALADEQGVLIEWNPAMERITGIQAQEAIGCFLWDLQMRIVLPERRTPGRLASVKAAILQSLETGQSPLFGAPFEVVAQNKSGEKVYIQQIIFPIKTTLGYRLGTITQDITGRKQAEAILRDSEIRERAKVRELQTIMDAVPAFVWVSHDRECLNMYGNQYTSKLFRLPEGTNLSMSAPRVELPTGYQVLKNGRPVIASEMPMQIAAATGIPQLDYEYDVQFDNGPTYRLYGNAQPILNEDGQPEGVVGVFLDVTRLKQAEEETGKLSLAIQQSPASVVITDKNGMIEYVNPKFCELTGYSAGEALGQNPRILKSGYTRPEEYAVLWETISSGNVWQGEFKNKKKNGDFYWESASISPVKNASGEITQFLAVKEDITGKKDAEQTASRRMTELTVLHEMALAGNEAFTLEDLLQRVTFILGSRIYTDNFGIGIINPDFGTVDCYPSVSSNISPQQFTIKIDQGVTAKVIRTGQPQVIKDIRSELEYYEFAAETLSEICVPLKVGSHIIGTINAESSQLDHFNDGDLRLLVAVADELGFEIEKIRLIEKTQQQLQRLTSMRAIDQSILSSPNLENVLELLLEKITSHLAVDAADILLYDPHSQILRTKAMQGMKNTFSWNVILGLGESHAGKVAQECKMEWIPDLSQVHDILTERIQTSGETFTSYLAMPLMAKGKLNGVLQLFQRSRLEPTPDWMDFLQMLANQAAIAIDNSQMFREQEQVNQRLIQAYDYTLDGWIRALDLRDRETEEHSKRVIDLTLKLAVKAGIPDDQMVHIRRGALLHDIGKMGIPDKILLKEGPLTPDEWVIMKQHPLQAVGLLLSIEYLQPALDIPYSHHEKWDGSGYPLGLKGEEIPLAARIFAIADVWDALTSDRPYRKAWTQERALTYIREESGKHFDPTLVAYFLQIMS